MNKKTQPIKAILVLNIRDEVLYSGYLLIALSAGIELTEFVK
jgi:hypothetical protein